MTKPHINSDPLKIRLTRPWRVAIMVSLIASFFVLAPSLILYTSGFRLNLSNGNISTTGVISVDTEPIDAEVYINGTNVGNKQPLRLDGLVPGIYEVRISKEGFHDFTTVITLRSQETSYIKGVTLWEKTSPKLQSTSSDTIVATGFNSTLPPNYYYLSQHTTSTQLSIHNPTATTPHISFITSESTTCSSEKNHCIWWSPVSKKLHLVNLNTATESAVFASATSTWQWSSEKDTLGFFETKTGLQSVNTDYISKPTKYTTSGIWFIGPDGTFFSTKDSDLVQYSGNDPKVIVTLPQPIHKIITGNTHFALVQLSEYFEIINNLSTIPTHETIRASHFFHDQAAERWLLWSPWEITSVNSQNGTYGFLYRSAEPLRSVFGLEPTGSILIVTDTSLTAFNPGYVTTQELARFTKINAVNVDQKNRTIIVAGSHDDQSGIFTFKF